MKDGTYSLILSESPDGLLSGDVKLPDVSLFTGLAVIDLGWENEQRLFFHDANAALNQLRYTSDGQWEYLGIVNPDNQIAGPVIGAAAADSSSDITVVQPRGDKNNVEISSSSDNLFDIGMSHSL